MGGSSGSPSRRASNGMSPLLPIHVMTENGEAPSRVMRTVHVGTSVPYTGAYHPRPARASPRINAASPLS